MIDLTWDQVCAWHMRAHSLAPPAPGDALLDVTSRLCGIHAQVLSSAELALCARSEGLRPAGVRAALWERRDLVRTWSIRGTLHLLTAGDLPLYVAALRHTCREHTTERWQRQHDITGPEIEALTEAVHQALDGRLLTRDELAAEIGRLTGSSRLEERARSSWGAVLGPAAFRGYLIQAPGDSRFTTFARPDQWLGGWREVEPHDALREVARRYFAAYGPAGRAELMRWWNLAPRDADELLADLADELVEVRVDGQRRFALPKSLEALQAAGPSGTVRLLAGFDQLVVNTYYHSEHIVPAELRQRVLRTAGWVTPCVVIDGRIAGLWSYETRRGVTTFSVEAFPHAAPFNSAIRNGIEAEAERIAGLFESATFDLTIVT